MTGWNEAISAQREAAGPGGRTVTGAPAQEHPRASPLQRQRAHRGSLPALQPGGALAGGETQDL